MEASISPLMPFPANYPDPKRLRTVTFRFDKSGRSSTSVAVHKATSASTSGDRSSVAATPPRQRTSIARP
jgi:hypothetical protein